MPQVTPAQIAARAKTLGIRDPAAVLAVLAQEGLGGGIGDNGTSFGPGQLHKGGAYPASAPQDPARAQAWAWSPQGIDYLLSAVKRAVGNKTGAAAIRAMVTNFERPANPGREIAGALAAYGKASSPAPGPVVAGQTRVPVTAASGQANPVTAAPAPDVIGALLAQVGRKTPDYSNVFQALEQRNALAQQPSVRTPSVQSSSPAPPVGVPTHAVRIGGATSGLNTGFEGALERAVAAAGGTKIRVDSGYRSPAHNAAVGGVPRSNHLTGHAADGAAYVPGRGWVPLGVLLQSVAAKFGLRSGNVPGFYRGGRDAVHVDDGSNMRRR